MSIPAPHPSFRFLPLPGLGVEPARAATSPGSVNASPARGAALASRVSHARWNGIVLPSFSKVSAVTRTRPARTSPPSTSSKARRTHRHFLPQH